MGKYLFTGIDSCLLLFGILHRAEIIGSLNLFLIIIRIKRRNDKGKNHNKDNHHKAYHCDFILAKASRSVLPEAHALTHNDLTLLLFLGCRKKIFRF